MWGKSNIAIIFDYIAIRDKISQYVLSLSVPSTGDKGSELQFKPKWSQRVWIHRNLRISAKTISTTIEQRKRQTIKNAVTQFREMCLNTNKEATSSLDFTKLAARVEISQIQTKITLIKNNMELNLPCCFSLADRSCRSCHSWFI